MPRTAAAVCLVLAPIALAIATGTDPALGDEQGFGVYREHPDAIQWHSLLLHWAWTLFVPGFLGLLGPIRRRGAALGRIAWLATVLGLTTFSALMMFDFVLLALEQHLPNEQVAQVNDAFGAMGWAQYGWAIPGMLGWAVALVLTPIAAARAKVINWWIAAAALAGTALYFLFAISPVPVSLTGPIVLIGAYGAAAVRLIRHRDEDAEPDRLGAFRHRAGIISLYAAPIALAAGMATAMLSPEASALLLHLAWVLFIPAVLTIGRAAGRFTQIAVGVAVVGLLNLSGLMVGDYADMASRQVLSEETANAVAETVGGYALFSLGWATPGMLLTLLGLIAVGIAVAVERTVPWWVPVLVVVGLAAFLTLPIGPLGVIGPLVLVGGFAAVARQLPAERSTRPLALQAAQA